MTKLGKTGVVAYGQDGVLELRSGVPYSQNRVLERDLLTVRTGL